VLFEFSVLNMPPVKVRRPRRAIKELSFALEAPLAFRPQLAEPNLQGIEERRMIHEMGPNHHHYPHLTRTKRCGARVFNEHGHAVRLACTAQKDVK